jgi:hypothetical protein
MMEGYEDRSGLAEEDGIITVFSMKIYRKKTLIAKY